ncbi:Gpb1p [Malassezia vespertilionis]|uniref:Gpb1p n=1 Tax=Malassezia vespertilionis TaxID=2020962 RepID=A0A2N1JHE4_9BASI|nr:Gpb1p [Malassezia vespertilionis]
MTFSALQDAIVSQRDVSEQLKARIASQKDIMADTSLRTLALASVPPAPALSMKRRAVLKTQRAKVASIAWAPDDVHLLSASQDGFLILWDTQTALKEQAVALRMGWVLTCAVSPAGDIVASGGLDNVCTIFDLKQKTNEVSVPVAHELHGHNAFVSDCLFRGEAEVLTSSGDGTCALWDVQSECMTQSFEGHIGDVMSISFSKQNPNLFVSGACDDLAMLWDTRTGRSEQTFTGHSRDVNAVCFFPDGQAFATGSDDASCRLYDLRARRELAAYGQLSTTSPVTSLDFTHSGRVLVVAYDDNRIHMWDTLRGERNFCNTDKRAGG